MHRIHNRILIFVIKDFNKLQTRYEIDLKSLKSTIQFSYHLIEKENFVATNFFERLRHSISWLRYWTWLIDKHFNSSIKIFNVNRRIFKHVELRFFLKKTKNKRIVVDVEFFSQSKPFVVNNLNDQINTRLIDFSSFNIEFSDLTKKSCHFLRYLTRKLLKGNKK